MMDQNDVLLEEVTKKVVGLASAKRVILYNCKHTMDGAMTSFKLCIVTDAEDKGALLRKIYSEVDSDIPFDVLLYTEDQFERLRRDAYAFASQVDQKGKVLYGE